MALPWEDDYSGAATAEAPQPEAQKLPWEEAFAPEDEAKLPEKAKPIAYGEQPKTGTWRDDVPTMIKIESGGNPNARTGKYTGLFQMGPEERAKYGGDSYEHGMKLLEDRAAQLSRQLGREPTGFELYLAHQQGLAGSAAHLNNPDQLAWKSMLSTGEGRAKGEAWAKKAIWGNVPDDVKAQYGSVDNITSAQFVNMWQDKWARKGGSRTQVASAPAAPSATGATVVSDTTMPWETQYGSSEAGATLTPTSAGAATGAPPAAGAMPWEDQYSSPPPPRAPATTAEAVARSYYKAKGGVGATLETLGEALGTGAEAGFEPTYGEPLREFGKGVREQAREDVKAYPAQPEFLKIRGAGDAAIYARDTLIDFGMQAGASIVGGVAGGALGGPVGAVAGATAPSLALNIGDIASQIKEEDPNAVAPGWALGAGTAAAALDVITPARLGSKLGRFLIGRFGADLGEDIAKETLRRAAARGYLREVGSEAGKSAAIEGLTEAAQEVIGEYGASGALDRPIKWDEMPTRMIEAGAAGALGGAVFGGAARAAMGREPYGPPPEYYGPPEMYGPPEGYGPPREKYGPPNPFGPGGPPGGPPTAPPTPPLGTPPGPGQYPGVNFPVGGWEDAAQGGGVEFPAPGTPVMSAPGVMSSARGPEGGLVSRQVPEALPNWYHSTIMKVFDKLPSFGSPQQMLATLTNNGAKEEELEAMGIPEFLKNWKGKISKDDLISEIESRALNVNVLTKEAPAKPAPLPWTQGKSEAGSPAWDWKNYRILQIDTDFFSIYRDGKIIDMASALADAKHRVELRQSAPPGPDPRKHKQYVLPNGENYREHLFMLPPREKTSEEKAKDAAILAEVLRIEQKSAAGQEPLTKAERTYYREHGHDQKELASTTAPPRFVLAGHWREPDVFTHTRTNDRVMMDGKTTLHMEELQGDWPQLGHKHGYKSADDITKEEIRAQIRDLDQAITDLEDYYYEVSERDESGVLTEAQRREMDQIQYDIDLLRDQQQGLWNLEHMVGGKQEKLPFKSNWVTIAMKKMIHMAATEGKDRVSWTPGLEQNDRWSQDPDSEDGRAMRAHYDDYMFRVAKKIANKWPEARVGHAYIDLPDEGRRVLVPYFEMTERTREAILGKGFPLFSRKAVEGEPPQTGTGFSNAASLAEPWRLGDVADARAQMKEAAEFGLRLLRKLGVKKPVFFKIFSDKLDNDGTMAQVGKMNPTTRKYQGNMFMSPAAAYRIDVSVAMHPNLETMWASIAHEIGHIVSAEFYHHGASPLLKLQIDEAYQRHLQERASKGISNLGRLWWMRDNYLVNWFDMRGPGGRTPGTGPMDYLNYSALTQDRRDYWLGFEEWFAEQVARHFTTSKPVLNAVDRFFSKLGKALRSIYDAFKAKFGPRGYTATADDWIAGWLDSRLTELPVIAASNDANKDMLADANMRAMNSAGIKDYPRADASATSIPGRKLISEVGETIEARSMAAAADRFNGFYKWMLSIVQVAARNLHIQPLQRYVELWQQKQLERAQMMSIAVDTLRAWRNLGKKQADNVSAMLDAYQNMEYLSNDEFLNQIVRKPTDDELAKMQRDYGLNDEARKVFDRVTGDFQTMLLRYEAMMRAEAMKLGDPIRITQRLNDINEQMARLRQIPYVPAMRFGDLVMLIKDQDGNVRSRYHFETERARSRAKKQWEAKLLPGEYIELTAIPEQAKPFMGLPPGLLDLIAEKLNLSDVQRKELNELKYEYAPAHGFAHRFQRKSRTPGYSTDFMRAYANYMFHGSNYYTNVKYVTPLRDEIGLVRLSAEGLGDGTKRIQIHNFMNEHLNYMLDPKPDFAHLRGLLFHWGLGFSPAAAFVNLSQMAIGSYPFLAGKFGDAVTMAAMTRAGTNLSTYYKRGKLAALTAARDMRALSEGVKQGIITEAMAPELAGLTEQDNLRKGSFGKATEVARLFAEASSFMFQTTEQINRRVTFRAAWQLALDNPSAQYVKDMTSKHSLQYQSLIDQGWAENEAAAFVVAKDAVESTQFIYHQWANPKFMRGKLRTAFIFKNFMQNTLFMLWHYPEARVRALLVFAFLGGLMGLPGAEDMKNLIKAIGWRLFGKDWDVEQEARKLVVDMTNGAISPDLLLHGTSRYSFGASAALALAGIPFPNIDMSKNIGLGRILPFDPNTAFGIPASRDPGKAFLDSVTQLGGYAFQVNRNFYTALTDTQLSWDDAARWTKAMPRALAGLSRAYQAAPWQPDPALRTRTGAAVVRFDPTDPAQLMEVVGMGAGFQPSRVTQKWDVIIAQREATDFWHIKREGLLRQAWQARSTGDQDNYVRAMGAIRDFNANLPTEARTQAITAENIIQSFRTRALGTAKTELGISARKSDIPLIRDIQRLYPGAEIDVHRTR